MYTHVHPESSQLLRTFGTEMLVTGLAITKTGHCLYSSNPAERGAF
jgi:hypothetical protein